MTDFEKVIDFDNMYRAFRKAKCGKGHKKSAARFNLAALDGIHSLITQLKDKTYRVSDYTEFKVYEPKERVIQTTSFKDTSGRMEVRWTSWWVALDGKAQTGSGFVPSANEIAV